MKLLFTKRLMDVIWFPYCRERKYWISNKSNSIDDSIQHGFMVSSTSIYARYRAASDKLIAAENEMKQLFDERFRSISWTIIRPTMIYGTVNDTNISTFMKWLESNFPDRR